MTSDPAVWHQALAHVRAAEEEEARTLEAQNDTLRSQHAQIRQPRILACEPAVVEWDYNPFSRDRMR
jgi:hypothetical protein